MKAGIKREHILMLLCIPVLVWLMIQSRNNLADTKQNLPHKEMDLYLPEADYLKFISLGHNGLVSDLVLAKALTYYGAHYKERDSFSFRHLEKLFVTAVKMDPRNIDAFLIAGNTLSSIRVQSAIDILELGMKYHPQHWKFPEMIGFYYFFHLNDPFNAGKYYELAAAMPGHPPYVPSLSGKFYQESGRYAEAIRVLNNFYTTTRDKRLKKNFGETILAVKKRMESKNFSLNARITEVITPNVVRFQRDKGNPLFQGLAETETLRMDGLDIFPLDAPDEGERLKGFLQKDYADAILKGRNVQIRFIRKEKGELKRDSLNRFWGSVFIENKKFKLPEPGDYLPESEELDITRSNRQIGRMVRLRFRVHHISSDETMIYLNSAAPVRNRFRAAIPKKYSHYFKVEGGFGNLQKKKVTVMGYSGVVDRKIQVNLYLPAQLSL